MLYPERFQADRTWRIGLVTDGTNEHQLTAKLQRQELNFGAMYLSNIQGRAVQDRDRQAQPSGAANLLAKYFRHFVAPDRVFLLYPLRDLARNVYYANTLRNVVAEVGGMLRDRSIAGHEEIQRARQHKDHAFESDGKSLAVVRAHSLPDLDSLVTLPVLDRYGSDYLQEHPHTPHGLGFVMLDYLPYRSAEGQPAISAAAGYARLATQTVYEPVPLDFTQMRFSRAAHRTIFPNEQYL